ncbi:MAG: hypothetical protein NT004_19215 [Bacteroidetes bacterium]|nr:hypothetical protein [Bacteroidota bacterium]
MKTKNKTFGNPEERNFQEEYYEIFSVLGKTPGDIRHEWIKPGDSIKEFTLYDKSSPTPILTPNTFPITY